MAGIEWAVYGLMVAVVALLGTCLFALLSRMDTLRSDLVSEIRDVKSAVVDLDRRLTRAGG